MATAPSSSHSGLRRLRRSLHAGVACGHQPDGDAELEDDVELPPMQQQLLQQQSSTELETRALPGASAADHAADLRADSQGDSDVSNGSDDERGGEGGGQRAAPSAYTAANKQSREQYSRLRRHNDSVMQSISNKYTPLYEAGDQRILYGGKAIMATIYMEPTRNRAPTVHICDGEALSQECHDRVIAVLTSLAHYIHAKEMGELVSGGQALPLQCSAMPLQPPGARVPHSGYAPWCPRHVYEYAPQLSAINHARCVWVFGRGAWRQQRRSADTLCPPPNGACCSATARHRLMTCWKRRLARCGQHGGHSACQSAAPPTRCRCPRRLPVGQLPIRWRSIQLQQEPPLQQMTAQAAPDNTLCRTWPRCRHPSCCS